MRGHHALRRARATWAPSRMRRVMRSRLTWWIVAALLAVVGTVQLGARVDELEAERAAWGQAMSVAVVVRDIAVGHALDGAVEYREFPADMVPPGAVDTIPPKSFAKVALFRDEIVLGSRITGAADDGLPAGSAAVTVDVAGSAPLVDQGDLVDLWSVDSANQTSRQVGRRLLVLARSDDTLTVAVPVGQVGATTAAALRPVMVVLVG